MYYQSRLENDIENAKTLQELFGLQKVYEHKFFAKERKKMSKFEWILVMTRALIHEACETEDEVKWKHWKKESYPDINRVREEIVDQFIFVMNQINVVFTQEEFVSMLKKKMQVNVRRQREGYGDDKS